MKKSLFLALALLLVPALTKAVAPPTGLSAGYYVNSTLPISWNNDAAVTQWYIYVNGALFVAPYTSQTALSGTVRSYGIQPLASTTSPWTIYLKAVAGGQTSAFSAALTASAGSVVPGTYVIPAPGTIWNIGGAGISVTVSAANNVSITSDISTASSQRNTSLNVISAALTGTAASPLNVVSGNITITSMPAATQGGGFWGVSVTAHPANVVNVGISVTARDTSSTSFSGGSSQLIVSGTATASSTATFTTEASMNTLRFVVSGNWTGTLQSEQTMDGVTWIRTALHFPGISNPAYTFTANSSGVVDIAGTVAYRLRSTAAMTGTAYITAVQFSSVDVVYLNGGIRISDAGVTGATATVTSATAAATASNSGLVVSLSPNSPLPGGLNSLGSISVTSLPSGYQGVSLVASSIALPVTVTAFTPTVSVNVLSQVDSAAYKGVSIVAGLGSVTITGTVSGNQTQINGATLSTGLGAANTGTQRVSIASDNIFASAGNVSLNAGTNTTMIGGVNISQMNSVAVTMGNGISGTGVQRVAIASDNTANTNPWLVVGSIASASTDSGNPLKTGGIVNTTLPTFTAGQRANTQMDVNGKTYVNVSNTSATPVFVNQAGMTYFNSVSNNSSAQLTATATYTGAIEYAFNQQAVQVMVACDQPYTVSVDQFNGASTLLTTDTFTRTAGQALNENILIPGDYVRVRVQNTGAGSTTTFNLETTYGPLPAGPRANSNLGNGKVAVMELNGTAVSVSNGAADAGTQRVVLANNGAYQGVSVVSGLGSVTITSMPAITFPAGYLGVSVVTQVDSPAYKGVTIVSDATTRFYGMTITSSSIALPVTVTAWPAAFLGVSISGIASGISFTAVGNGDYASDGEAPETNLLAAETYGMYWNGTSADRVKGNTNGTFVQGSVSATVSVAGNPILNGGRASTTAVTAVSDGAMVSAMFTKTGKQVVALNDPREMKVNGKATLTNTTPTLLLVSGTAGTFNDITTLYISNGSTQTVRVDISDGATIILSAWCAANGGGVVIPASSLVPQSAAATSWWATASQSLATNDIRVFASFSQNK